MRPGQAPTCSLLRASLVETLPPLHELTRAIIHFYRHATTIEHVAIALQPNAVEELPPFQIGKPRLQLAQAAIRLGG
jgi:hypothetical protein